MRVLADENVPARAVAALRQAGHDVAWVRETMPGADDRSVLSRARSEDRVLLTFDKDFAELVFRGDAEAPAGVVLVRVSPASPNRAASLIVQALATRNDWPGHFSVIEPKRVRLVPLPPQRH